MSLSGEIGGGLFLYLHVIYQRVPQRDRKCFQCDTDDIYQIISLQSMEDHLEW